MASQMGCNRLSREQIEARTKFLVRGLTHLFEFCQSNRRKIRALSYSPSKKLPPTPPPPHHPSASALQPTSWLRGRHCSFPTWQPCTRRQHGIQPHRLRHPVPHSFTCPRIPAALCNPVISHHRPSRPPVCTNTVRQGTARCVFRGLLGNSVYRAPGGVHEGSFLALYENMSAEPAKDQGTGKRIRKG